MSVVCSSLAEAVLDDAFWVELRARVERERAGPRVRFDFDDAVEHRPVQPALGRAGSSAGRIDELHEALLAVPADEWVSALIDVEVSRSRMITCPFHADGLERTPSCRVYDTTWNCFGCNRGGDIFNFAALLWGVDTRSAGFPGLRQRLAEQLMRTGS